MQADLLGAHALGLRNLLLVTGAAAAPRPSTRTRRLCSTSIRLASTNVAARFNRGEDVGGQPIGQPTAFHIGVRGQPDRRDARSRAVALPVQGRGRRRVRGHGPDLRRRRLAPVPRRPDARRALPVIAVVRAFEQRRQAEQLANEEPGVQRARVTGRSAWREAERDGRVAEEALAIARELVVAIRPLVAGIIVAGARRSVGAGAGHPRGTGASRVTAAVGQATASRRKRHAEPQVAIVADVVDLRISSCRGSLLMALFGEDRSRTEDELLQGDAATRALSVTAVENDFVEACLREARQRLRPDVRADAPSWPRAGAPAHADPPGRHDPRGRRRHRHQLLDVPAATTEITGIDFSAGMLEKARERVARKGIQQRPPAADGRRRTSSSRTTRSTSSTRRT